MTFTPQESLRLQVTYAGLTALLIHHLPLVLLLLLPFLLPGALQLGGSSSGKRPSSIALLGRMLGATGLAVASLLTAVICSAGSGLLRALISGILLGLTLSVLKKNPFQKRAAALTEIASASFSCFVHHRLVRPECHHFRVADIVEPTKPVMLGSATIPWSRCMSLQDFRSIHNVTA